VQQIDTPANAYHKPGNRFVAGFLGTANFLEGTVTKNGKGQVMTLAEGESVIRETIFENRFMHAPELARLGADIHVQAGEAVVHGVATLHGAQVMATDLRASVSLVIAGMAAQGETTVGRVYHLDRGFERLEEKLSACGAEIRRVRDSAHEH
jgi:UDP-N-acetylglucosamine 1-carboxyvinyltransferase